MKRRFYIGFIIIIILIGVLLDQQGQLSAVRANIQWMLAPLYQTANNVATEIDQRTAQTEDVQTLQLRLSEAENRLRQLEVENIQLREMARENERLRQLLNYTEANPQFTYQPAVVVGRTIGVDPTNLLFFVYVDVGARDGVAEGMPVITDRGLVGRVTAVGANSAQVLMLIDPSSAINALIQTSRATGIVRGNIDGTLTMDNIPQGDEVFPGDIVLTSGLGGNFPSKLVIGQVTEVSQRDQDMFQTARIRPTVDFGKLDTLLIITSFEPVDFEAEIRAQQEAEN